MSNSIEQIPSGATHKTPKGTYMKHAEGAWFEWLHEWVKVDVGVHVNVNQLTEVSGDGMSNSNVPTADIDWSKAPKGATHHSKRFGDYYKAEDGFLLNYLADESRWIVLIDWSISALESPHFEMIRRPESIHDVARSIEAARVAERTYPHYFKDVSAVDAIDLYHVARLYDITDPALFHAFKKIACAGKRGAKDQAQDVQEAIDALKRWRELNV